MNNFYTTIALNNLSPGSEWAIRDGNIEWLSDDAEKPSDKEIKKEVDRLIKEEPAKEIRQKRDSLLLQSDWVVVKYLETGEELPQQWKKYRQSLRDVPQQDGFPKEVKWPNQPG